VDEQRLAELFRDAAGEPPPASFDERDIAVASRDADRRHRRAVRTWGVVAASVVVLAGVAVGIGSIGQGGGGTSSSTASPASVRPFNTGPAPGSARPQGRLPDVTGGEENGCGPTDPNLLAALAGALPTAGRIGPVAVNLPCPAGARAAGYQVRDGAVTGVVAVVLTPAGATQPLTVLALPRGAVHDTEATASGGRLTVLSEPAAGATVAPFANLVGPIARQLAASH
jgi:hypothetical protein